MYPHRIRLRGPWECVPVETYANAPPPAACRVKMPCRWDEAGWGNFTGRVRCVRRFGYPGRLDAFERVWITCAGVRNAAELTLNGCTLGRQAGPGPFEFEVTPLLRPRNELVVLVDSQQARGGLWGEVALEIRCPAFLRGVRAALDSENRICAEGEVVGQNDRPLDLYVLYRQATVAYSVVNAGTPFYLMSETVSEAKLTERVRVELVDGALVWYSVEVPCMSAPD
jgi:hypothetical protein